MINTNLLTLQTLKRISQEKAYQNPAIAEEEKNERNEKFKSGDFSGGM